MSTGMSLHEIMRMASGQQREEPKKSNPEVLCETLRETYARYAAPCPFKVGDLVTPRRGTILPEHGDPQIIIEVFEPPLRNEQAKEVSVGSRNLGSKIDVRVMCEFNEHIITYVTESWMLEPYTGPKVDIVIQPGAKAN